MGRYVSRTLCKAHSQIATLGLPTVGTYARVQVRLQWPIETQTLERTPPSLDAYYDRGCTLWLRQFRDDEASYPEIPTIPFFVFHFVFVLLLQQWWSVHRIYYFVFFPPKTIFLLTVSVYSSSSEETQKMYWMQMHLYRTRNMHPHLTLVPYQNSLFSRRDEPIGHASSHLRVPKNVSLVHRPWFWSKATVFESYGLW